MQAGKYRHRITLQRLVEVQDTAGQLEQDYEDIATSVPASIEPMSGREYVSAQQVQSEVTTRIEIRWQRGLDTSIRILHEDTSVQPPATDVYDVTAALPDPVSGRRWITFMCTKRVAQGWRQGNT